MEKKKRQLSASQRIVVGFFIIILVGALLLMLPFAARAGEKTTLPGALLTAVSATCVTGLVAYDTWSHWTIFGQLVILTLIQIGGLGFITISTFAMIMLHKKIGISRRTLIQEGLSTLQIRGSVRLVRRIIFGTLLFEGGGALLLMIRFVPQMGWLRGIYYGIFHAVSAFCNAGFDLMGYREPYASLTAYYADPLVIPVLSALIIIGGLGFIVWEDLMEHRLDGRRYRLQTKIVLSVTALLLLGGTLLFLYSERHGLFAGMTIKERLLSAWFSAVTPRTAGFNSVDTASLSDGGLFLTVILMFIGGSPGSTAGGIKTVTLLVIFLQVRSYVLRKRDCEIFGRRIDDETVRKANMVLVINLLLAVFGVLVILMSQDLPIRDVLFEVFSAIGTAGMSTGVTRSLHLTGQIVVMLLMFCGRMGSLTFAMSFTEHRKTDKIRHPSEDVNVG